MNLAIVFQEGDSVLIGVFLSLLVMSVLTWYLILSKSVATYQWRRHNRQFLQRFWDAQTPREAWQQASQSLQAPLARMADAAFNGMRQFQQRPRLGNQDEFLVRNLRNGINRETSRTSSGMTLLASIGSTAPFIGLFGTVWGIYHALITIAQSGNASMEMVAGPLGEALVATAAGLAAAIPAVLAYNAFQRANRTLHEELDGFAHDLHAFLMSSEINEELDKTPDQLADPADTTTQEQEAA